MGKRKNRGEKNIKNFSEVNKLIANFLEEVAKDFSEYSGNLAPNAEPITYKFNIEVNPNKQPATLRIPNIDEEPRDLLVDTIEKEAEVSIIAEMPGVAKNDIKIIASHNEIMVEHNTKPNFNRRIRLKGTINPDSGIAKFRNGILELTFNKSAYTNKSVVVKIKD